MPAGSPNGGASVSSRPSYQRFGTVDLTSSSIDHPREFFRSVGPATHRLPQRVMWSITLLTATSMALINFVTIWSISFVVKWKFGVMQSLIDQDRLNFGIGVFIGICTMLASIGMALVFFVEPKASSSGAPENKGWLNGNELPGFFTVKNLVVRQLANMLANTAGYPLGREGPTVTMGSNLAYLITTPLAEPYVRQYIAMQEENVTVEVFDEQHWEHVRRIACTVGGACGMAMLFDSPIGGIVYMFEEVTSTSWPMEVTLRAFVGTTICAVLSRVLLALCGTSTKAFVVYEFDQHPDQWSWLDMPFFMILAAFIGPFSAYHTRWCLWVAGKRQSIMSQIKWQPWAKALEGIFYIVICSFVCTMTARLGKCYELPEEGPVEYVRYNCAQGSYNPVASLLLTTSEGAIKRLFSRKNDRQFHLGNEILAFLAYTTLNIGMTGVPVPSGNFTGSMLIGGLLGRIMGAILNHFHIPGIAVSGVYAMIGSAAMLCGFKQMCVAVVVFISGCCNDLSLVPPLMLSVTIALLLNRCVSERGFDEEQIMRKCIPFLPAEPPTGLDSVVAWDLCDEVPEEAVLPEVADTQQVRDALDECKDLQVFPVVKTEEVPNMNIMRTYCVGFTTRQRLEEALRVATAPKGGSPRPSQGSGEDDQISSRLARNRVRRSGSVSAAETTTLLLVSRLTDRTPYTLLEDTPGPQAYAIFSKAGVRVASVISETGEYRGMISKAGLILKARECEETKHRRSQSAAEGAALLRPWAACGSLGKVSDVEAHMMPPI